MLQEDVKSLQQRVAKHTKAIRLLREQVAEHSRALRELSIAVQALGLRYGLFTEKSFRESIKYLVEDLLKQYKAQKWV